MVKLACSLCGDNILSQAVVPKGINTRNYIKSHIQESHGESRGI